MGIILTPFAWLLMLFYDFSQNYGIALILFALVIKLVLFPFNLKGKKSMIQMNLLSGKMQQLQKQYGKDRERYNLEIQKLYEKEKVNPMSGCLWSFIPIIFLMVLYGIIREPLTYLMNVPADMINTVAEITGVDLSGLNETALSAFNVDGKQYGLPGNFSNVVLVYNKDLFDQAGVAYPTDDWTQDDLQAAAEAIRALGDDIYGIYQPITYNEFYKVAAQYGGSLLNDDLTEFTINSPENIQAAQVMVDRVLVSNVQPTEVQMGGMGDWDLFMSGRLGMIPTGIWAFNTFTEGCDFAWDIAVEPGAVQKATHFFSNACVINAQSENKEAAATWITWLTSSPEAATLPVEANSVR